MAVIVLLFLCLSRLVRADTTFADGTFDPANWVVDVRYAGGNGSGSAVQQSSGGNPGSYYQVTISTTDGPSGITAFLYNSNFTYSPSSQGAISSVDFSLSLESQAGVGTAFVNLALEQNNQMFIGPEYDTSSNSWVTFSQGLGASSFGRLSSANGEFFIDSTVHPDFSATGADTLWGFTSIFNADSGAPGGSETMGVDNYDVVLHLAAVPEPSTVLLVVAGFVTITIPRLRHRLISNNRSMTGV